LHDVACVYRGSNPFQCQCFQLWNIVLTEGYRSAKERRNLKHLIRGQVNGFCGSAEISGIGGLLRTVTNSARVGEGYLSGVEKE
jgi:hypothetical protein